MAGESIAAGRIDHHVGRAGRRGFAHHQANLGPTVGSLEVAQAGNDHAVAIEILGSVIELVCGVPDVAAAANLREGAAEIVGPTGHARTADIIVGPRRQHSRIGIGISRGGNRRRTAAIAGDGDGDRPATCRRAAGDLVGADHRDICRGISTEADRSRTEEAGASDGDQRSTIDRTRVRGEAGTGPGEGWRRDGRQRGHFDSVDRPAVDADVIKQTAEVLGATRRSQI